MMRKYILILFFITSFFVNAQTINQLPVQLVYFNATKLENNFVLLQWGTATETNNFGYNVERSTNQADWIVMGFVPGNGNSFSPKDYLFIDSTIVDAGDYYYRLRQFDFDGAENISDIVGVVIQSVENSEQLPNGFYLFNNYPNPFNPTTTLQFYNPVTQRVKIDIYDISGSVVKSISNDIFSFGIHKILIDLNHQASGIYLIRIETKSNIYTQKIILIK